MSFSLIHHLHCGLTGPADRTVSPEPVSLGQEMYWNTLDGLPHATRLNVVSTRIRSIPVVVWVCLQSIEVTAEHNYQPRKGSFCIYESETISQNIKSYLIIFHNTLLHTFSEFQLQYGAERVQGLCGQPCIL